MKSVKRIVFDVTLTFSDEITNKEAVMEVLEKTLIALRQASESGLGLAPEENGEGYTEEIEIREPSTNQIANHKFI